MITQEEIETAVKNMRDSGYSGQMILAITEQTAKDSGLREGQVLQVATRRPEQTSTVVISVDFTIDDDDAFLGALTH